MSDDCQKKIILIQGDPGWGAGRCEKENNSFKKSITMSKNYIIGQCCSVDDLRISMSHLNPDTPESKKEAISNLTEAIEFENNERKRISIIKILESKKKAILRTIKV